MRPKNWREVEAGNRSVPGLTSLENERIVRLARFVDELPGISADYQHGTTTPRPSWGTKLGARTIWYVGYQAFRDDPILKVLPRNAGWPKLPESVITAFTAEIGTLERDTQLKIRELSEAELIGLERATRAAVDQYRRL